jgi:undecaprenyl-diphosphatase
MGLDEIPVLFDILMHIPTLLAVVLVFRKTLGKLLLTLFRFVARKTTEKDREYLRLLLAIGVATVCTAAVGFALSFLIDSSVLSIKITALLFIATALLLIVSWFFKGDRGYDRIGLREGITVGVAQGIGVLPGISRSGITLTSSLVCGLKREKAGEFAFLLAIPATLGALVLKIRDLQSLDINLAALASGLAASFVVGLASLVVLLKIIRRGRLYLFSLYLIPLGIATFFLL